jgi:hypothetical protein
LLAVGLKLQAIPARLLFDPPLVLVALQASGEGDEPMVQAAHGVASSLLIRSSIRSRIRLMAARHLDVKTRLRGEDGCAGGDGDCRAASWAAFL